MTIFTVFTKGRLPSNRYKAVFCQKQNWSINTITQCHLRELLLLTARCPYVLRQRSRYIGLSNAWAWNIFHWWKPRNNSAIDSVSYLSWNHLDDRIDRFAEYLLLRGSFFVLSSNRVEHTFLRLIALRSFFFFRMTTITSPIRMTQTFQSVIRTTSPTKTTRGMLGIKVQTYDRTLGETSPWLYRPPTSMLR